MYFTKHSKQLAELQDIKDILEDQIVMLKQENAGYKQTISAFVGVKTDYENQVKLIEKKHVQQLDGIKKELEAERKSVNKRVNKALADIGVVDFAPEDIGHNQSDTNPKSIYSKFMALPQGKEKDEFWMKHEKTITNFAGLR